MLPAALALLLSSRAAAQGDYDPENEQWNGLSHLVDQARQLDLELEVVETLDFATIDAETSLLLIYPIAELDQDALISHLRRGGRMLIADDFGVSDELLERLGVRRNDQPVTGGLFFRGDPNLPIAAPVDEQHLLAWQVRRLLTNHPTTLVTDLPPVFVTGDPPRTLVAVGAIGEGRLVILGDPSALINNMLEVRSNQQFARNLLSYLGGDEGTRRLVLVSGRFSQLNGSGSFAGSAGEARRQLNLHLGRLNDWLAGLAGGERPPRWLAALAVVGALLLLVTVVTRLEPRPRLYTGRWLKPAAEERSAGFVGTLEYLKHPKASHLYPLLILKRVLEERLLEGLGLEPPARLDAVMAAYAQREPRATVQKELERMLVWLSNLSAEAASTSASPRVSAREVRRAFEKTRRLLKSVDRDIEEP